MTSRATEARFFGAMRKLILIADDNGLVRQLLRTLLAPFLARMTFWRSTRQPLELARTKSFGYSVFNLRALMGLATLANELGIDLWQYRAPNGGSIRAALNFLVPYALGEKKWPYQQIEKFQPKELIGPLLEAAAAYHDKHYEEAAEKFGSPGGNVEDLLLMAGAAR